MIEAAIAVAQVRRIPNSQISTKAVAKAPQAAPSVFTAYIRAVMDPNDLRLRTAACPSIGSVPPIRKEAGNTISRVASTLNAVRAKPLPSS